MSQSPPDLTPADSQESFWSTLASLGPAIVVASVVLGPGSIMTSTKVGCQFGYDMLWIVPFSAFLMFAAVALSARLGSTIDGTICDELTRRCGRWFAALIGITIFLVVALFQSSNNAAFLVSMEPFIGSVALEIQALEKELNELEENASLDLNSLNGRDNSAKLTSTKAELNKLKTQRIVFDFVFLGSFNLMIIFFIYTFKHLYHQIERLMKFLIAIMLIAFIVNLIFAKPDWGAVVVGFIPKFPAGKDSKIGFELIGIIATTFSVAGAFYQGYLVREKGWGEQQLKKGLLDSAVGIATLGLATCMVMITSAAVLHGNVPVEKLTSTTAVAGQLEPAFGSLATMLFAAGIFAAMFSSFAVNAMIGGTMLSDGFGVGAKLDDKWPKIFTVLALLVGMLIALFAKVLQESNINLIVVAQALTVLGNPLLAFSLLYLSIARKESNVPAWVKTSVAIGCVVTLLIAARTTKSVYEKLTKPTEPPAVKTPAEPQK